MYVYVCVCMWYICVCMCISTPHSHLLKASPAVCYACIYHVCIIMYHLAVFIIICMYAYSLFSQDYIFPLYHIWMYERKTPKYEKCIPTDRLPPSLPPSVHTFLPLLPFLSSTLLPSLPPSFLPSHLSFSIFSPSHTYYRQYMQIQTT